MKKIKTINKLLSSLTLLSPLSGIGFNNQYQNIQNVITENNKNTLNNYISNETNAQRKMGDITVNVDGTKITGYVQGEGKLIVDSDITEIGSNAFSGNNEITSLDTTNALNLEIINNESFSSCSNLSENIIFPSNLKTIGMSSFAFCSNIRSLNFSKATKLIEIKTAAFQQCENLTGDLIIPPKVLVIDSFAFAYTRLTSLDLSNATNLTTIGEYAFNDCSNLSGDLVIPSSVTSIGTSAFMRLNITSLDLSNATSLTTIENYAFLYCSMLKGNFIIPDNITHIGDNAYTGVNFDNLYFLSETPPTSFGTSWNPTVTGKIYVPSEQAKQAYATAPNFSFNEDQIEIGIPPEPTSKKSYIPLILALLIGLGIPVILAIAFVIWYFTKKKKTTVKI